MLVVDENNNIKITRGDSAELTIALKDAEGETYDYSEDVVKFGVKRSAFDTSCVIEKTVTDSKVVLTPADTETLEFGDYLYDVEVRHTNESEEVEVYTPISAARFTIGYNVL